MQNFRNRILRPLSIPLGALAVTGALVWGMSRFLLATDKNMAVVLAFVTSFTIVMVAAFLANGRLGKAQLAGLVVMGLVIVVGGSVVGATLGVRPIEPHVGKAQVVLTAKNLLFDKKEIALINQSQLVIELINQDAGVPHDIAISRDEGHSEDLFDPRGDEFPGLGTKKFAFSSPGPGKYFFYCSVHPGTMNGTVTIGQGSSTTTPPHSG